MALFELKLQQSYQGQILLNTYTYQSTGTPAAVSLSFALASAFGAIPDAGVYPATALLAKQLALQSTTLQCDLITVRNPYSLTDFYETPFNPNYAGTIGGEPMSPTVALGFRSNRVRQDIRRGTKRLGGQSESAWGTGGSLAGTMTTPVSEYLTALNGALTYDDEGNTLTFTPIIVSKEKYAVEKNGVPTGTEAYRWYETEAEQLQHIADGIVWDVYNFSRTQTSRQYGRGR